MKLNEAIMNWLNGNRHTALEQFSKLSRADQQGFVRHLLSKYGQDGVCTALIIARAQGVREARDS